MTGHSGLGSTGGLLTRPTTNMGEWSLKTLNEKAMSATWFEPYVNVSSTLGECHSRWIENSFSASNRPRHLGSIKASLNQSVPRRQALLLFRYQMLDILLLDKTVVCLYTWHTAQTYVFLFFLNTNSYGGYPMCIFHNNCILGGRRLLYII